MPNQLCGPLGALTARDWKEQSLEIYLSMNQTLYEFDH